MKKLFIWTIFFSIFLGAVLYVNAASLPPPGDLPDNSGLRRDDIISFVGSTIKSALGLVGAILLVLIVYGGFVYATAAGNDENVKKGKNILTYAIIGIVIISGAWILTDFIVKNTLLDN